MYKAVYDYDSGKTYFEPTSIKAIDPRKLQAGMFADRPDLWHKPRKATKPNPSQMTMFEDPDNMHLDFTNSGKL